MANTRGGRVRQRGPILRLACALVVILARRRADCASPETPAESVALGTRVHGGFGSLIALGIRIGLDARRRLGSGPRQLHIDYQDGPSAPCWCVVDGIMLATVSTPGQRRITRISKPRVVLAHLQRRRDRNAGSAGVARFGRLDTFFHITQRALRQMELQGGGHVVTITTTMAEQPIRGVPAGLASLTKGGLDAVTRELAIEYADRAIRVNAVAPGVIKTGMHPKETHAVLSGLHPLGRMGEISDVVAAVLYLENAPFVTGEIAHVDGGQSAGHW